MKTEEKSEKINRILGIISAVIGIVGSIFGIFQAQQAATLKNEVNSLQTASQQTIVNVVSTLGDDAKTSELTETGDMVAATDQLISVYLEMVSSELHAAGAQPVFEMLAPPGLLVDIELGSRRVCRTEKVAEDPQALIEREFLRHRGQCRQLGGQIGTDAGKVGAGFLDVALDDTDGKIPLPDDAIVALGDLSAQHLVEFLPVVVQAIFLERQQNRPLEFLLVDPPVVQSDLGRGSGGQCIEQVTVVQEHRRLIILAGDGIVDVGERPGLGELVAHLEDPVRPDATNGNAVLHAARNEELYTLLFPRFGQGLDQWRLSLRLRFFCFGFFIRIPPWIAS